MEEEEAYINVNTRRKNAAGETEVLGIHNGDSQTEEVTDLEYEAVSIVSSSKRRSEDPNLTVGGNWAYGPDCGMIRHYFEIMLSIPIPKNNIKLRYISTIYSFYSQGEEGDDFDGSPSKSSKTLALSKKVPAISQAHLCNLCNYTSPKR